MGPSAYAEFGLGGRFFVGPNGHGRRDNRMVDANGQLIAFDLARDGYNRNPEHDLAIPTLGMMAALEGEVAITPSVTAHVELNYGRPDITSHVETFGFRSQSPGSLFGSRQATIPIDNPFVPAPLRAAADAFNAKAAAAQRITALTWWQRFGDVGGVRGATDERLTQRIVLGLNGESTAWGRDWRCDLDHVEGRTDVTRRTNGMLSTANLYHGLRVEPDPASPGHYRCADAAARAAGCVPINPFADHTPEMLAALRIDGLSQGTGALSNTVATISGPLAEGPAGDVRIAAGVERRCISGWLDVADVSNLALATGTPIGDTERSAFATCEAFVETLVPVLAGLPAARSLNLGAADRRSWTDRRSYDTWKFGGDCEPVRGLRLRGMRARSARPTAGSARRRPPGSAGDPAH